ncbi:YbaB/EbfC family nucleoid-associated protein [Candidatus Falkowbacteria bacterium]|nr:YbaB/EbfC family nucleoid-associated protein [Candidatus Falkowbacteria bacterium]NCT54822.1 YbaB/EbfC family nucleoid-associated protein [Candidatus Falkowbacteria bacterium]
MFNKLKQFKDLRDKAKTMQSALAGETISQEKNGIKVSLNGNLEIIEIKLNSDLNKNEQENSLKSCLNEAIKKTQKVMAKKMQDMGGFPGLS